MKDRDFKITSRVIVLALLGAASGCMTARVRPTVNVAGNWAEDPARDRAMREQLKGMTDALVTHSDDPGIEVYVGKIPAGLEIQSGVLQVKDGAPYEILGRASIDIGSGSALSFADYEQGWRKGLCYWQVPLTWITLATWMLVPVNYPCGVDSYRSKEYVLTVAKNLVRELGGQIFVGDYFGETRDDAMGINGFIIRRLGDPAAEESKAAARNPNRT